MGGQTVTLEEYYESLKRVDTPVEMRAGIRAVPKGRPRLGRRGKVFTPQATKDFEEQIRLLAVKIMGHRLPYGCPVKVTMLITEVMPSSMSKADQEVALAGYTVPQRGDTDNRFKAVTDAMNGIVFHDDVQVGDIVANKRYGKYNLISVTIERSGLSGLEIDRYKKLKKASSNSNDNGHSERRPAVGKKGSASISV